MSDLYWNGPRESDIEYTGDLFSGSCTFFGSNNGNNSAFCSINEIRINHNIYNTEAADFIQNWQLELIKKKPDCRFMSYNPNWVYAAPSVIVERTVCLNEGKLMSYLDNKIQFRKLFGNIVPMIPMMILTGAQLLSDGHSKCAALGEFDYFIAQDPFASGGEGTFVFRDASELSAQIGLQKKYIVTGYLENNISVNIHAIIYDNTVVLFPGSVQIIQKGNGRLLYRGADYITYKKISLDVRLRFENKCRELLKKVQEFGYRGIIGVDAIIVGNEVLFMEINNRFQGSSVVLGKALMECGAPSLQSMNLDAFSHVNPCGDILEKIKNLIVPYSIYMFMNEADGIHSKYIYKYATSEKHVAAILSEGYDPDQVTERYALQYSIIFNTNITDIVKAIDENRVKYAIRVYPNLVAPSNHWMKLIGNGNLTMLKIALINRGVVLTQRAKEFIHNSGGMREGTYLSLDLFIRGTYMNSPLYVKFNSLSPFRIDLNGTEDGLILMLYDETIEDVQYDRQTILPDKVNEASDKADRILFFATDRLRIQNNSYCTFFRHGVVCKFCEANGMENNFTEQEILGSLRALFTSCDRPRFRHILIGGLSNEVGMEKSVIIHICNTIRNFTDMPIYLMCLPPKEEDIKEYVEAGITEFGFNLEIYNRNIAALYMPGKGRIPIDRYINAIKEAVRLVGKTGNVRSAFIVGLEPMESLLKGIEDLCKLGAVPILSVFRPIPGTEMENVIPPDDDWLYSLTCKAEAICRQYGLTLGPACPACRNNTLTIVNEGEVFSIDSSDWSRE